MFRHIGIVVRDLNRQIEFYRDVIGLEIYYHKTESGAFLEHILGKKEVRAEIVKLGKNQNTIVELLFFSEFLNDFEHKSLFQVGYTHFAITVENIDDLAKKVDLISEPKNNEEATFKVCFCKDPEGNFIELVQCISNQA